MPMRNDRHPKHHFLYRNRSSAERFTQLNPTKGASEMLGSLICVLRHFFGLVVIFSLLATQSKVEADLVLTVDPGNVGSSTNFPLVDNHTLTDPVLNIVFAEMKHVEVEAFGWDIQDAFPTRFLDMWLTDDRGAPIPGSSWLEINGPPQTELTTDSARITLPSPVIARGVHFEWEELPDGVVTDIVVTGRVGVPEPSTFAFWSLLGITVAACKWRRYAKVLQSEQIRPRNADVQTSGSI